MSMRVFERVSKNFCKKMSVRGTGFRSTLQYRERPNVQKSLYLFTTSKSFKSDFIMRVELAEFYLHAKFQVLTDEFHAGGIKFCDFPASLESFALANEKTVLFQILREGMTRYNTSLD